MACWTDISRFDSTDRNVFKYVFKSNDAIAEAVLYRYPEFKHRTVVCCSVMSGCPIGCRFCGSGDYYNRPLSAPEIIQQIEHCFDDHAIDPGRVAKLQLMFMSMGEPLLNLKQLSAALRQLYADYPNAQLLVSTMGPKAWWWEFEDLCEEIPTVGLQFSIHESTDEARDRLIPFEKKLTLKEIACRGENWHAITHRQPFFNYCAHAGNTSEQDALRLRALFDPAVWQATVSVVCEREESVAAANQRQRKLAQEFVAKLLKHGYSVRMFDPAGQDDIGGGCGQLWHTQKWMRAHPVLARPSIGRKLPVIHAPTSVV